MKATTIALCVFAPSQKVLAAFLGELGNASGNMGVETKSKFTDPPNAGVRLFGPMFDILFIIGTLQKKYKNVQLEYATE